MRSKQKNFPELEDEFAAEVSEFDTLDAYKADIKAKSKNRRLQTVTERKKTVQ